MLAIVSDARASGYDWTAVDQAKARLDQANAQVAFTDLRSPFAGTITEQFQYPGDMAQPGTPTFTVMEGLVLAAFEPSERSVTVSVLLPAVLSVTVEVVEPLNS